MKLKHTAVVLMVIFVSSAIAGIGRYRSYVRESGFRAVEEWTRTAPIPASATNVEIETLGGPFTRQFIVRFRAPAAEIDAWLDRSPGTLDVEPVVDGPQRTYEIDPGGGAAHAEVSVDSDSEKVIIQTYWS